MKIVENTHACLLEDNAYVTLAVYQYRFRRLIMTLDFLFLLPWQVKNFLLLATKSDYLVILPWENMLQTAKRQNAEEIQQLQFLL